MEEETKKKKAKLIPVKVIKAAIESAMVEFTLGGIFQRATIPVKEIIDGKAPEDVLLAGVPYGVPWEYFGLSAKSVDIANALRINGVWTYEDAQHNPNKIVSALQAVYGVDLAALLEYARKNK